MAAQGKIARLPHLVREEICQRLLNNEEGKKIIEWINASQGLRGRAAITDANLSEYRSRGFSVWLEKQDKIEKTKSLAEFCFRMAKAGGGSMDLPAAIAGGQLMEVLEDFDTDNLKTLLKADPSNYIGVIAAVARLQKARAGDRVIEQNEVRLKQNERSLKIAEGKYQMQFAKEFLKWFGNKRAEAIALDKSLKPAVQISKLRELMFGPIEEAADES